MRNAGFQECAPFSFENATEVTATGSHRTVVWTAQIRGGNSDCEKTCPQLVWAAARAPAELNQALIKALPFLQGVPLQVIHLPARGMNAWLETTIAGKMFLLPSVRFIIRWKKCTAP